MIEGLYSVTFGTPMGDFGGGIVVFRDGKVQGGDAVYFYNGVVRSTASEMIEADVHVQKYQEAGVSVFGNLREFRLSLTGTPTAPRFVLTGHMVGNSGARITVQCTRLV